MEIVYKKLKELKPYENNPRINDGAVDAVKASIKQFGFRVPIVIDLDNVIVAGHTRYKAAQALGIKEVPCVTTEDLTAEQVRAYRVADNKVAELAEWDYDLLNIEIDALPDFKFEDFGFEDFGFELQTEEEQQAQHEIWHDESRERNISILNLEKASYKGTGKYDIPEILPTYELPEIREWIGFNYVMSDKDPQGKGVHFFVDDYQFLRLWNDPDKYLNKLAQYAVVASPDFSPYSDMPLATQIFNHYRKHWLARYWQDNGITVIPTVRASMDERSLEWYLDGEPHGGIVLMSNMWTGKKEGKDFFLQKEYAGMLKALQPKKVFIYGSEMPELQNVTYIKKFTDKYNENGV